MFAGKGKLKIVLALACVTVFCAMLAACSGGSSPFAGTWKIYEADVNGTTVTYDQADDSTKALMDATVVTISDDGKFNVDDNGNMLEGTWKQDSDGLAHATINTNSFVLTLEEDKLTIVNSGGQSMVLTQRK